MKSGFLMDFRYTFVDFDPKVAGAVSIGLHSIE